MNANATADAAIVARAPSVRGHARPEERPVPSTRSTGQGRSWGPVAFSRGVAVAVALLTAFVNGVEFHPLAAVGFVLYSVVLAHITGHRASAFIDVVVSAGLLLAYQQELAPFLVLSGVAAYSAGVHLGPLRGALLSCALSAAQLPTLVPLAVDGEVTLPALAALMGLYPLTGALAGFASQRTHRSRADWEILFDTHRILLELDRIADRVPAGLDTRSVSTAALDELVATLGTPRAFLLTGVQGVLRPVASHGPGRTPLPVAAADIEDLVGVSTEVVVSAGEVPPGLRGACLEHDSWLVLPLRLAGHLVGVFFAAVHRNDEAVRRHGRLRDLASESALAVENARLFGEVQSRAADVARRRIAHDLHDGVAQSLAHIRMELDLLSRSRVDAAVLAQETARLSAEAARALDDVRATITGLRSASSREGIVAALRTHVEGLNGLGGPRVSFEAVGTPDLDGQAGDDLLRIAQEALSNAVRHSGAMHVLVSLEAEGGLVSLAVEDDGRGIPPSSQRRDGVGLRAMRDRADRLGAQLTVRDRRGSGTVVALSYTSGGSS